MKHISLYLIGVIAIVAAPVFADDHAEHYATCVADISEKAEAAGHPLYDPSAVCDCFRPKVLEDPALLKEIEDAGGLPPEKTASDALKAALEPCLKADKS